MTVDDSRRATVLALPGEEYELEASDANGTKFRLSIPSDALSRPAEITMAPVIQAAGAPFGGLVGAVRLEPSGLAFAAPLRLLIEPASPVPVDQQIPFTTDEDGGLIPAQIEADPGEIALRIWHFTESGVGKGGVVERHQLVGVSVASPPTAAEIAMGAAFDRLRRGEIDQDELQRITGEVTLAMLDEAEARMKRAEEAAETGDPSAQFPVESALVYAVALEKQLQLLGFKDIQSARRGALFERARAVVLTYAKALSDRCIRLHDIGVIAVLRQLATMAHWMGALQDVPVNCLRFELRFRSSIKLDYPEDLGSPRAEVATAAIMALVGQEDDIARAPLPYTRGVIQGASGEENLCTSREGNAFTKLEPGELSVSKVEFLQDRQPDGRLVNRDVIVFLDIGRPVEVYDCDGGARMRLYESSFRSLHAKEWNQVAGWFAIRNWQMGEPGNALIATRAYEQSETVSTDMGFGNVEGIDTSAIAASAAEETTLQLVHDP
jgi:hypothetical protein